MRILVLSAASHRESSRRVPRPDPGPGRGPRFVASRRSRRPTSPSTTRSSWTVPSPPTHRQFLAAHPCGRGARRALLVASAARRRRATASGPICSGRSPAPEPPRRRVLRAGHRRPLAHLRPRHPRVRGGRRLRPADPHRRRQGHRRRERRAARPRRGGGDAARRRPRGRVRPRQYRRGAAHAGAGPAPGARAPPRSALLRPEHRRGHRRVRPARRHGLPPRPRHQPHRGARAGRGGRSEPRAPQGRRGGLPRRADLRGDERARLATTTSRWRSSPRRPRTTCR